ncbi:hypothetical protein FRB95_004086 [Tulasnella sp. JGI-2019a]|nr:hypothetical protein FRB95_004086 [Tulasnella sp. JGI-2019a]
MDDLEPLDVTEVTTLIIHTLIWCDPSMGDDARASIDKQARVELADKLKGLESDTRFAGLEGRREAELKRLIGILGIVDITEMGPPGFYVTSTRGHIEGSLAGQEECVVCMAEDPLRTCSVCKSVMYCGAKCQSKDWKQGHNLRCYEMEY